MSLACQHVPEVATAVMLSCSVTGHASRAPAPAASSRKAHRQYSQPVGFVSHGMMPEGGDVMHLLSTNMARASLVEEGASPMEASRPGLGQQCSSGALHQLAGACGSSPDHSA